LFFLEIQQIIQSGNVRGEFVLSDEVELLLKETLLHDSAAVKTTDHRSVLLAIVNALLNRNVYKNIQSGPEKNAQSLMHCHFAIVCSRITRFSLKCSEKITVYQPMQNFYQLVKHVLINSRIGYMLWATSSCIETWHFSQFKIDC